MTDRDILMRKIATYDFAIVELNLYLDTHPKDLDAHRKLEDYESKSLELTTPTTSQPTPRIRPTRKFMPHHLPARSSR